MASISEDGMATGVAMETDASSSPGPQTPIGMDQCESEEFRQYEDSSDTVKAHYASMRANQNVRYYDRMIQQHCAAPSKQLMTVREAFEKLDMFVDASDPDTSMPNSVHMLQSAEAARAEGMPEWFILTCLIHDLGKVLVAFGSDQDGTGTTQQWGLVGDTWVLGRPIPNTVVFPEFNSMNSDESVDYEAGCRIHNLKYAFGHDEYMYHVLLNTQQCKLPRAALAVIRLHSCYPWHSEGEYREYMVSEDYEDLQWVQTFNRFDLYTKHDRPPNMEELWPYYQGLIDQYLPGKLAW